MIEGSVAPIRRVLTARTAAGALALVGVLALAGCTSSSAGPVSAPTGAGTPTLPSSIPTDLSPTPRSSDATSTSAAPSSKPPSKSKPAGPADCANKQLKIDALRGSAAAGIEYALITFTNTGTKSCAVMGFPGVSLRLAGALVGKPAERSIKKPASVTLKPGAQAEAAITDLSSCQAPVSDKVRVYAPDQTAFVDLPLGLRACRIIVDPLTLS